MASTPMRKIDNGNRPLSHKEYARQLNRAIRNRTIAVDPEERYDEDEPKPVDEEFK